MANMFQSFIQNVIVFILKTDYIFQSLLQVIYFFIYLLLIIRNPIESKQTSTNYKFNYQL